MFKKVREKLEEGYCVALLTLRFFNGMSHGWAHDLIDQAAENAPFRSGKSMRVDFTTPDGELMKIAKRSLDMDEVRQAISLIRHETNLLGLAMDESVNRRTRIMAIHRLTSVAHLLAIVFGRDIELALAAVVHIQDQKALAVILRHSPFVAIRRHVAQRCDDDEALLLARARDEDDDVRWLASIRFAELQPIMYLGQA